MDEASIDRTDMLCSPRLDRRVFLRRLMVLGGTGAAGLGGFGAAARAQSTQQEPQRGPEERVRPGKGRGSQLRIGHYQCVCHAGEFEANLETVCTGLQQAAERGIELMSFPESFLGGYFRSEERCREHAWPLDGPQVHQLLKATASYPVMFMVGFNELRGADLYNTVVLVEGGELLGTYSKAFPVISYFQPGRETPVFEKNGHKFGIIICADGGYPEPTRIMVMKGARIIFAPHYNYITKEKAIDHYIHVRNDHIARAVENGVFFVRGNNVEPGYQESLEREGVGYGDSYILDPNGQMVAAANLHAETLIWADVDLDRKYYGRHNKAGRSAKVFWQQLRDAALGEETS